MSKMRNYIFIVNYELNDVGGICILHVTILSLTEESHGNFIRGTWYTERDWTTGPRQVAILSTTPRISKTRVPRM